MRIVASLAPLILLGAAPPASQPTAAEPMLTRLVSPTPNCRTLQVADTDRRLAPRRLGELPPADAYQAVYRLGADGCIDPLLVSDRIRGPASGRR